MVPADAGHGTRAAGAARGGGRRRDRAAAARFAAGRAAVHGRRSRALVGVSRRRRVSRRIRPRRHALGGCLRHRLRLRARRQRIGLPVHGAAVRAVPDRPGLRRGAPVIVIPAIDLRGGRCVRLVQGEKARTTVYGDDPVERARAFVAAGARRIHVVDLDGAFGDGSNLDVLRAIAQAVEVPVQTGGGVRTSADVRARLAAGAHDVILGTVLVEQPEEAARIAREFAGHISAGIDARGDEVAVRGWERGAGVRVETMLERLEAWGIERVIATQIERDGTGRGYDLDFYRRICERGVPRVQASGGAGSVDDLRALQALELPNLEGAIVGRAIYEGTLDLAQAVAELK
ncbi:1-(5-phosphoribosyl)-5-[(5-phosphoribosylamino)methylideneamino]imidazole-4-carboxamide isomerase [bacterium]|nr:MAG: 1-(5-phosphoribosyl)-5-[(5-phosphoribosylamino)methylideneamino]imidazole-4-carboxamide isomerase [bacterium]